MYTYNYTLGWCVGSPFLCSDWADRLGRTTGPNDEPNFLRHTQRIEREQKFLWSRHSVDTRGVL